MSVAKITEIKASSKKSFEDAVEKGVERACKTLKNVKSAWIAEQDVTIDDGKVKSFNVLMKLTFILED